MGTAERPDTDHPRTGTAIHSRICWKLQAAHDQIQDHGVLFSRGEDATGQGRFQINGGNRVVVDQTPTPGTPVGEAEVVLYVVKYSEPNSCCGGPAVSTLIPPNDLGRTWIQRDDWLP